MRSTILTLAVEDDAQMRFEALRQRYYPPALNKIGAHITLFHNLPFTDSVRHQLSQIAYTTQPFEAQLAGLQFLGRGVALKVASAEVVVLHARLVQVFDNVLIAQDRQRFQPHIVVQNKVPAELARATLRELEAQRQEGSFACVGLDWWEYLGGPWKHLERFAFAASQNIFAHNPSL